MLIKKGDMIAFINDLKANVGGKVILRRDTPVSVISINPSAVIVRLPNGQSHSFRNIPERMYKFEGEIAKVLFE